MRYDFHSMLPERAFQPRATGPFAHCLGMTREGGKGGGGSAPSPDPNIGIAQRQLADLATQQWENFRTQMWPEIQQQMAKQEGRADEQWAFDRNTQERQLKIAEEEYGRLKEKFYPLQDKLIAEADNFNTAGERERQAALAMGDTRDQFAMARQNARMDARSYGIDPTSGRYQGMERGMDVMEAGTAAAAATRARTAAEQLGWAKRMDAIGLGMGTFGNQATSTGLALNAGNAALNAGQTGFNNAMGANNAYNQSAGTAMSGWNSIGTLGVNKYNADVRAYAANQEAKGEMGGALLGGAATIGAAFI